MQISNEYKNKIFTGLRNMKDGEIKELDKCNPGYEKFVQVIKEIIDNRIDIKYKFNVSFNDNYSKIKKTTI